MERDEMTRDELELEAAVEQFLDMYAEKRGIGAVLELLSSVRKNKDDVPD